MIKPPWLFADSHLWDRPCIEHPHGDEEVERQLDALLEIVWRVVYLSGREAGSRRTPASPSKSGARTRPKSSH